ncbi:bifunctional phosphoglucose/phosphomannose isomerase [bacterium]|nr:bifunctional phosphoglucose/phosphomannose isomerase [bacterium]
MIEKIRNFYIFLEKSLNKSFEYKLKEKEIGNIIIAGMGGSAIPGQVIKDALSLKIPLEISRGYHLPSWVDKRTLVICISYSGNTKETINQFNESLKRKSNIIVITSNGKLEKKAKQLKLPLLTLPKGFLPRESFPFLIATLIKIFKKLKITKEKPLISFSSLSSKNIRTIEKEAKKVAKSIKKTFPIICSEYPSVSFRWESQLSENAKHLSESKTFPELAHNEIESWREINKNHSLIFLEDEKNNKEITKLIKRIKKIIKNNTHLIEIKAKGKTRLERILYLIVFGDFVSYFLAKEKEISPEVTDFIKALKKTKSK